MNDRIFSVAISNLTKEAQQYPNAEAFRAGYGAEKRLEKSIADKKRNEQNKKNIATAPDARAKRLEIYRQQIENAKRDAAANPEKGYVGAFVDEVTNGNFGRNLQTGAKSFGNGILKGLAYTPSLIAGLGGGALGYFRGLRRGDGVLGSLATAVEHGSAAAGTTQQMTGLDKAIAGLDKRQAANLKEYFERNGLDPNSGWGRASRFAQNLTNTSGEWLGGSTGVAGASSAVRAAGGAATKGLLRAGARTAVRARALPTTLSSNATANQAIADLAARSGTWNRLARFGFSGKLPTPGTPSGGALPARELLRRAARGVINSPVTGAKGIYHGIQRLPNYAAWRSNPAHALSAKGWIGWPSAVGGEALIKTLKDVPPPQKKVRTNLEPVNDDLFYDPNMPTSYFESQKA